MSGPAAPGPPEPSADDYRRAVEETLALFEALPSVEVDRDNVWQLQIAHGWATQANRFARCILVLSDGGFAHEARVIVRSLLEYAITLHWLVQVGDDAVSAVMAEHQRAIRVAADQAAFDLPFPTEAIREVLDVEVPKVDEQDTLRHFIEICKNLGVDRDLYIVYRVECSVAHPTLSAASEYLVGTANDEVPAFRTTPSGETAVVALAAHCLIWALGALDSLLVGRPLRSRLEQIAHRIGSAPMLPDRKQ